MSPEEVGPGSVYNLSSLEVQNIYEGITSTAFQRCDRTFYAVSTSRCRHSGIQCLLPVGSCLQDGLGQFPLWLSYTISHNCYHNKPVVVMIIELVVILHSGRQYLDHTGNEEI